MAIRILQLTRNSRRTWTFSALQTPPSMMPTSQRPQCLMSVIGERSNSTRSTSSNKRSSMSRNDMWHPKHPASEVVAMRSLRGVVSAMACSRRPRRILERAGADWLQVVLALADGHRERLPLAQDHADRADLRGLVVGGERGVGQPPRRRVDDQVLGDPPPRQREHVLAVDLGARAYAQLAQ